MTSGSVVQAHEMINSSSTVLSYAQGSQFDSERSHRYFRDARSIPTKDLTNELTEIYIPLGRAVDWEY